MKPLRSVITLVSCLTSTSFVLGYSGWGHQMGDIYYYHDNQGNSYQRQTIGNIDYVHGSTRSQRGGGIIILPQDPYYKEQAKAGETMGLAMAGCIGMLFAGNRNSGLTYEQRMQRKADKEKRKAAKKLEKAAKKEAKKREKEARKANKKNRKTSKTK